MTDDVGCVHCGRLMYRQGHDRDGRVAYGVAGMCGSCKSRREKGVPLPGNDYQCTDCHVWVDTGYGGENPPGKGGRCQQCSRTYAASKRKIEGRVCAGTCGRILRPRAAPKTPGTVVHVAEGFCWSCRKAAVNGDPDIVRATQVRAELAGFLRKRRERQEKAQRVAHAQTVEYARRMARKKVPA